MVRQRVVAVLALVVLLGLSSAAGSAAAEKGPERRDPERSKGEPPPGKVVKAGWWWAGNQPPAETGLVAYPQQSPPNVPAGSLPVAAAGGEPEKISAIELRLDSDADVTAESARVLLRESTAPGANSNAEAATILACPVTEAFWADGTAARWDSRPTYDCDLAQSEGVRRDNGRWVFDLTDLAALWLGESPTSPSFVLVEAVDSPESFQVAFDGPAAKGIKFKAVYLPVPADDTGSDDAGDPPAGSVEDTPAGGGLGTSSGGSGSSGDLSGDVPASITDPGATPAAGGDAVESSDKGTVSTASSPTTERAPLATAAAVPPWHAGLVKPALILVPVVVGLAYLAMVALGPDAQPTVASSRHGVGRALERLRQSTARTIVRVGR